MRRAHLNKYVSVGCKIASTLETVIVIISLSFFFVLD